MEDLIAKVFAVAMSPFTSGSFLVWLPCLFSLCLGIFMLVFKFMGRR